MCRDLIHLPRVDILRRSWEQFNKQFAIEITKFPTSPGATATPGNNVIEVGVQDASFVEAVAAQQHQQMVAAAAMANAADPVSALSPTSSLSSSTDVQMLSAVQQLSQASTSSTPSPGLAATSIGTRPPFSIVLRSSLSCVHTFIDFAASSSSVHVRIPLGCCRISNC